ncbi:GFA family protein [Undibacterium sp. TS12]|uniref:GFA family protein n=1 Tax=Undibacterium sp. TS12 TaxID=2908202 RepID=UPI001F4D053B|nr:GFA family protein [Undibacterium sp. TS12]MCH8618333.1 GFA family protein [Undibacterium sp. TS12]
MQAIDGRCSCGSIQYHYPAPALQVVACHCGLCRRMTGAALSVYVVVKARALNFTRGQDRLKPYAVTNDTTRHFCADCGTPIFNQNAQKYAGLAMLYLGTVTGHEQLSPAMALYCESRLPWLQLPESCQQFQQAPERPAK